MTLAFKGLRLFFILSCFFPLHIAHAALSHPETDKNFLVLSDGTNLGNIRVSGSRLQLTKGQGRSFTPTLQQSFEYLKSSTQTDLNHPVQWALMDLDSGVILEQSANSNIKQFGASVSKIFVAATLLDKQSGQLAQSQLQLMANMLVVSSNSAWTNLQKQIGNGNANLGRQLNLDFTGRMGYPRTRGFQGYLGSLHGNELTAYELVQFLYDTYHNRYAGAEVLWKIMHTCRTGAARGLKYIPQSIYVGGKTGTYSGTTVDPETGNSKNPDGSAYRVRVKHHTMVFRVNGRQYALAILANTGSDSSAALLAGGLIRSL